VQANAGAVQYAYDGRNKRIWQGNFTAQGTTMVLTSDSISVFGVEGKLIGTYTAGAAWNNTQNQLPLLFYSTTQRVYFGKKLVATLDSKVSVVGWCRTAWLQWASITHLERNATGRQW
jgi:hypothetical protein